MQLLHCMGHVDTNERINGVEVSGGTRRALHFHRHHEHTPPTRGGGGGAITAAASSGRKAMESLALGGGIIAKRRAPLCSSSAAKTRQGSFSEHAWRGCPTAGIQQGRLPLELTGGPLEVTAVYTAHKQANADALSAAWGAVKRLIKTSGDRCARRVHWHSCHTGLTFNWFANTNLQLFLTGSTGR